MNVPRFAVASLLAGCVLAGATLVRADDDEHEGRMAAADPAYVEECGACHVAFPPSLLSRASWRGVMDGLNEHFGTDASLDPAVAEGIRNYLDRNAGRRETTGRDGRPLLRITESAWFQREHRPGEHGMTRDVFSRQGVERASNCAACHRGAAEGRYGEREIRIPRLADATR